MKLCPSDETLKPREASERVHQWERYETQPNTMKTERTSCGHVCFVGEQGKHWPGRVEPWTGNLRGSAAGWCRWRSKGLHSAWADWQTASVGSHCAVGFPSDRRTCPSCRSAPGETTTTATKHWYKTSDLKHHSSAVDFWCTWCDLLNLPGPLALCRLVRLVGFGVLVAPILYFFTNSKLLCVSLLKLLWQMKLTFIRVWMVLMSGHSWLPMSRCLHTT